VLQQLDVLDADLPDRLRPFATLTLRNWAGRETGEVRAEPTTLPSTAAKPSVSTF
jgi:hypothetical protein